jgi:hypothetical protein
MNPIRHICRVAGVLTGLACAWLGLAVAAPAAFAVGPPPPVGPNGYIVPVPIHIVVIGGMPGWQIAQIAAGAALVAATVAVMADRAWGARRETVTGAA